MAFRRIPFQFSSTDPVERQAELEKRFGLPSRDKMYVDLANPLAMGASKRDLNQSSGSPRLQHRVPIFVEGYDQPVKSSEDSIGLNSDAKRKPNVRVVPIEIVGDSESSNRHRTCSGPAGWANKEFVSPRDDCSPLKRSMQDLSQPSKVKAATGPQIYNIPVHIEKSSSKPAKVSKSSSLNVKENGCTFSNLSNKVKSEKTEPEANQKAEPGIQVSLKKIEKVLEELKPFESGVQEFVGTVNDKQYRYLDEMLTRCMLRLDDVETMGNDQVRSARKSAIKKVQACIDLLETKINGECESTNNNDIQDNISLSKNSDIKEIGDDQVTPECSDENAAELTEIEMAENKDTPCEESADTKISDEVTKLQMIELQEINLDSQTEVEMEESKSSENESTIAIATKETDAQMTDVSSKNVNSEVSEVEMMESKLAVVPRETESQMADVSSKNVNNEIPEVEMMESKLAVATKETEAQMVDVSSKNMNSEIHKIEMIESKPAEAESPSACESSEVCLSQDIVHSNMLEDKISATKLSNNPKSEESCCQSLDDSSIKCNVSEPEITNEALNLSADQISTDL